MRKRPSSILPMIKSDIDDSPAVPQRMLPSSLFAIRLRIHFLIWHVLPIVLIAIWFLAPVSHQFGVPDIVVFGLMWSLTGGLGISIGFHRYFTHRSFEAGRFLQASMALFGSMAAQGPLSYWVAIHRAHHQHSDEEDDPHSPANLKETETLLGNFTAFVHGHIGWTLRHDVPNPEVYSKDIRKSEIVRFFDQTYTFWTALGVVLPGLLFLAWDFSTTGLLRGSVSGGLLRIVFGNHIIWGINSFCHYFGARPFSTSDESRNNWWFALPAFGEGWHNNHHAFPTSARLGLEPYQIDTGWMALKIFQSLGLAWNVKQPSRDAIRDYNSKQVAREYRSTPKPNGNQDNQTKENELLLTRLEQNVATIPNRIVYRFLTDGSQKQSLSFGQLDSEARKIGSTVAEYVGQGETCMLMYPHGVEFVPALVGAMMTGAIPVPVYPPRKSRRIENLRLMIDQTRPRVILTSDEGLASVEATLSEIGRRIPVLSTSSLADITPKSFPMPKPEHTAILQFTSGSTGFPKGVVITHGNIAANQRAIQSAFNHDGDSCVVGWLPLYHDMGLIGNLFQPLYVGFPSALMSPQEFLRNPIVWLKAISDFRGTSAGGPNFAFEHCLKNISDAQMEGIDLSSWKTAFNGAEPVRGSTLKRFAERFSRYGFDSKAFLPCYGMAETTLMVSGGPFFSGWKSRSRPNSEPKSLQTNDELVIGCGTVAKDLLVRIVSPDTLKPVPDGTIGEVWVSGPSVAVGYYKNAQATEESFGALIAESKEGPFLRTGDLGFLDKGELFISGRYKDLIILRGRNLYPQDVESLVESCVGFAEPNSVAAFSFDDDQQEQLGVVIEANREMVRKFSKNPIEAEKVAIVLVAKINEAIAEAFELVPRAIWFVRPGSFPRTTSGKVQRKACAAGVLKSTLDIVFKASIGETQALTSKGTMASNEVTVPIADSTESGLESILMNTITSYLTKEGMLPAGGLAVEQSLMGTGLDSLSACDLAFEVEKKVGLKLTADTIYEQKTIRNLARFLALASPSSLFRTPTQLPERSVDEPTKQAAESLTRVQQFDSMARQFERYETYRRNNEYFYQTEIEAQGPSHVIVNGKKMLMMASYSYLGLIGHPKINAAVTDAIERFAGGVHGARGLAGTLSVHVQLENRLARFMNAEAAIVYSSGFITNSSVVAAIVGDGDMVIGDQLIHVSLADGCRNSRARYEKFHHNDLGHLEDILRHRTGRRVLVVVDSVYSMDGDIAPIPEIVQLCRRFEALLMVDEAHSLGVLGKTGRGVQEHFNLPADAIDIKMGTLSKAIPSSGGFIASTKLVVEFLRHNSLAYMFSGSPTPTQTASALSALEILEAEPERVTQLNKNAKQYYDGVTALGFKVPPTQSPIVPILFGSEKETLNAVRFCRNEDLFVVPVFYPAVPMNSPRIRSTVLASHTSEDIEHALSVLSKVTR